MIGAAGPTPGGRDHAIDFRYDRASPLTRPAHNPRSRITTVRGGVRLAHREIGDGWERPMVFIHGWGCDGSYFKPQQTFFARDRRTISLDLRGHGESDAPVGGYSMSSLAHDVAQQCRALDLARPILVGHGLGGRVALTCATQDPDLVAAVVTVDSVPVPSAAARDEARRRAEVLSGADHLTALPGIIDPLFSPTDDVGVRSKYARSLAATPKHVLVSAMLGHVADEDPATMLAARTCSIAYVGAELPSVERARLLARYPLMRIEQTAGAGHFSPLLIPDRINAMLDDIARRVPL